MVPPGDNISISTSHATDVPVARVNYLLNQVCLSQPACPLCCQMGRAVAGNDPGISVGVTADGFSGNGVLLSVSSLLCHVWRITELFVMERAWIMLDCR